MYAAYLTSCIHATYHTPTTFSFVPDHVLQATTDYVLQATTDYILQATTDYILQATTDYVLQATTDYVLQAATDYLLQATTDYLLQAEVKSRANQLLTTTRGGGSGKENGEYSLGRISILSNPMPTSPPMPTPPPPPPTPHLPIHAFALLEDACSHGFGFMGKDSMCGDEAPLPLA